MLFSLLLRGNMPECFTLVISLRVDTMYSEATVYPCDSSPEVTEYQCISGSTSNKKKSEIFFDSKHKSCLHEKFR